MDLHIARSILNRMKILDIFDSWKTFKIKNFPRIINIVNYSKSLRFGFRDGSPERSPKMNKETKKIIVV